MISGFLVSMRPRWARLLGERLQTMLRVLELEIFDHALCRHAVLVEQIVLRVLHLQVFLSDGDYGAAIRADLQGDLVRFALQVVFADDAAHQAVIVRFFRRDRLAGEQHQRGEFRIGDRPTHGDGRRDAEQPARDRSSAQGSESESVPVLDAGNGERGVLAGNDDITAGYELTSGRGSQTEHFGNDRNGQLTDPSNDKAMLGTDEALRYTLASSPYIG